MPKINKTTPHLFMWICNGKQTGPDGARKFGDDELLLPHPPKHKLDYVARLKEECAMAAKTGTAVYLAYMRRLMTDGQRAAMEDLANQPGFENLCVFDYDEVERQMPDVTGDVAIIKRVAGDEYSISKERRTVTKGDVGAGVTRAVDQMCGTSLSGAGFLGAKGEGLMNVIDSTRLVLLHNSINKRINAGKV